MFLKIAKKNSDPRKKYHWVKLSKNIFKKQVPMQNPKTVLNFQEYKKIMIF